MTTRPLPPDTPPQVTAATDAGAVARRFPQAFIDGGAQTIRGFLDLGLVTEARIFTLPIRIGAGVRLFAAGPTLAENWRLVGVRAFPCGTVGSHYRLG